MSAISLKQIIEQHTDSGRNNEEKMKTELREKQNENLRRGNE